MPNFTQLVQWELLESGDVRMRLQSSEGKFYDCEFARDMMPALMVILNQAFMMKGNSDPAFKEMVQALIPQGLELATLPGEYQAIVLHTRAGMRWPLVVSESLIDKLSEALVDLRAILRAESSAGPKH